MNCRGKTLCPSLLLFAAILINITFVNAQNNILTSYPNFIYKSMMNLSKWEPDLNVTDRCKLTFSSNILVPADCEAHYDLNLLDAFKSKLFFNFDIHDQDKFQKIIFELQPQLKIRGLLGLHKNQKKPLVIFRMGIHGNIDEFLAERFLIKLIYEDLGFHVLALESLTSHGFLKLNDRITIGGFEEGLHTFYVLNLIQQGHLQWSNQVSDFHLMGVSMSGAGLFLATFLDEQNGHLIKSTQAFCPLINLEKNFQHHAKPGIFSAFFDLWNSVRSKALMVKNPQLSEISLWPMLFDLHPRFTPAVFKWLNEKEPDPLLKLETFKKEFPNIQFPKSFIDHIQNSKNLFELNNFWSVFKNEKTPIQIYVTPNDPGVVNFLNTDLIQDGKQPGVFSKTKITELKGIHCALAGEYQWPFLVEIIRRGFLPPR